MCTLVHFLTHYMRPEQRPAAALADSSEFSSPSLHGQVLSPTTVGHSGNPISYYPDAAEQRKVKSETKQKDKGKKTKENTA